MINEFIELKNEIESTFSEIREESRKIREEISALQQMEKEMADGMYKSAAEN